MDWFKKNFENLNLFISFLAILISIFSYMKAYSAEERARNIEFFSLVKDVAKNLNIEFSGDSLSFNSLNISKNEPKEEKNSRLRDASISILALENIAQSEQEKDGVMFLRLVLLLQQREYQKIDALLSNAGGKYDQMGFILFVVMRDYRDGLITDPELLVKNILDKDKNNILGNFIYALLLKDNGDYEKSLQHLKLIEPFLNENPSLLLLRSEIIALMNH